MVFLQMATAKDTHDTRATKNAAVRRTLKVDRETASMVPVHTCPEGASNRLLGVYQFRMLIRQGLENEFSNLEQPIVSARSKVSYNPRSNGGWLPWIRLGPA